jgi:hypothetical protein
MKLCGFTFLPSKETFIYIRCHEVTGFIFVYQKYRGKNKVKTSNISTSHDK